MKHSRWCGTKNKTILEKIRKPSDLKKLNILELKNLSKEIRNRILNHDSNNGGHVGANLTTVDFTIALHYTINSPKDKIVWDVGHQIYTHKILTERNKEYDTIYKYKGLDGFPRREESKHDTWDSGHSSIGLSAATGISEAIKIFHKKNNVYAVIGDGCLSGGLTFEGLNNAGFLKTNVCVILNDNNMFISEAVGALSNHLKKVKPNENFFTNLGFKYFGPIDGHNIEELIKIFKKTKNISGPKIIHLKTTKGKGYKYAEQKQDIFHGCGPFDIKTGKQKFTNKFETYTGIFGKTLIKLANKDKKIVAITPAMSLDTGLTGFKKKFPKRFFDVGIAEPHAITFAAGMATQGIKPFITTHSTFIQRTFDQLVLDAGFQKLPIKICLSNSGLDGYDGPTHHGVLDISFMRMIPNFVVMAPKDENELQHMINTMAKYNNGPISVRYPEGEGFGVKLDSKLKKIEIGKAEIIETGKDLTIIALGAMVNEALKAKKQLNKIGIFPTIINARFAKPIDEKLILNEAKKTGKIITVEENTLIGGFGEGVSKLINDTKISAKIINIGIPDKFINQGSINILRKIVKCNSNQIINEAKKIVKGG